MAVSTIDPNGLNVGQFGNRNLILNGSMAVAQRATSVTGVSSTGYHTCDRYRAAFGRSEYVCTVSQDTSAPSGFANSYKIATTTSESALSAGDQINISQRLEGQNSQNIAKGTSDAKQLTLSFWVKSSIATTWTSDLYDYDNTRHCSKTYTTDVANTWEYKTITFPADTTGAFGNDNGASLFVRFWLDAGTDFTSGTQATAWAGAANVNTVYAATGFMTTANSTWQITGLQLEVGDTPTPFEHTSFGDQLQKCQRYLYAINAKGHPSSTSDAYARFISFGQGANASIWFPQYPVQMRALPSLIATNVSSSTFQMFNYNAQTSVSLTGISQAEGSQTTGQVVFTTASGISAGDTVSLRWNLSPNASFQFDAEL